MAGVLFHSLSTACMPVIKYYIAKVTSIASLHALCPCPSSTSSTNAYMRGCKGLRGKFGCLSCLYRYVYTCRCTTVIAYSII